MKCKKLVCGCMVFMLIFGMCACGKKEKAKEECKKNKEDREKQQEEKSGKPNKKKNPEESVKDIQVAVTEKELPVKKEPEEDILR